MNFEQVNPYRLKRGGWFWRTVLFENTPVFTIRSSDAHEVVALLNTAYNLGFNSGRIYGETK